MNGEVNCLLAVCCPDGSPAQLDTLTKVLVRETGVEEEYAQKCATYMLVNFDLAEKGTLTDFKASIARLARGPKHKP